MGRIVVSTNVTLDGVIEDPTGQEGFAHGGWFEQMADTDRAAWAKVETEEALAASAILFGARSYEWFARRWADREGAWADRLRALPKYVVSRRPVQTAWGEVALLGGTPAGGVLSIKQAVDGDVVVYGSGRLLGTLFDHDLVDELRLMVFPTALGAGRRLFEEISGSQSLALNRSERVGDDLLQLVYEVLPTRGQQPEQ